MAKSQVPAKTFSTGSNEALRNQSGRPNVPDFSFDPETGKPALAAGEEVVHEGKHNGLPVVVTNCARRIYLCSLDEYEEHVEPVSDRELYLHFYPQAEAGPGKGKAQKPAGGKGK